VAGNAARQWLLTAVSHVVLYRVKSASKNRCCQGSADFGTVAARKGKVFCERPLAVHLQQPEKDTQNIDFPYSGKIFADAHAIRFRLWKTVVMSLRVPHLPSIYQRFTAWSLWQSFFYLESVVNISSSLDDEISQRIGKLLTRFERIISRFLKITNVAYYKNSRSRSTPYGLLDHPNILQRDVLQMPPPRKLPQPGAEPARKFNGGDFNDIWWSTLITASLL